MTEQPALGTRAIRLGYVTINVSDLERSKAFYENVTPLRMIARTKTPMQAFRALGVEQGRFDGYVMDDRTGGAPACVHLVQWREPAPHGKPLPVFYHAGFTKIAFFNNDVEGLLAKLAREGVAPSNKTITRDYISITDPDGTIISFPANPGQASHLLHVMAGPKDLDRTIRFYRDLIGLEYWSKNQAPQPMPASHGPDADIVQWDSHIFRAWGDHRFNIDVSKILHPPQIGEPHSSPFNLGIIRVGIEVLDIDTAVASLAAALPKWSDTKAKLLGPIETWDFGPEAPKRRVAVLQDPDGMWIDIYEPERSFRMGTPTSSGYVNRDSTA